MSTMRDLYGGAIRAALPQNAIDISCLRQVPDNQEVYAHPVGDQSIIFDILEYAADVQDADAARFHFEDVLKTFGNGDEPNGRVIECRFLENRVQDCDCVCYLNGQEEVAKYKENAKNLVNFHICLFRFKKYLTDILVTFNDTQMINPESSSFGAAAGEARDKWTIEDFKKLIDSFKIEDYTLFKNE